MNERLLAPNSITESVRRHEPVHPEDAWIPREVAERMTLSRTPSGRTASPPQSRTMAAAPLRAMSPAG